MPTAPHSVLTRDELVEVYEIWQLLGPMATARAATLATREQLLQAVELVSLMRTADEGPVWARYNLRFHGLLENAGGGPRVTTILGEFREITEGIIRDAIMAEEGLRQEANAEHEEILRAVLAGDAEAAADATFRHLNSRLRGMLAMRTVTSPVRQVPAARG
jgi:DNA-binding GntR family transcriptional regulator